MVDGKRWAVTYTKHIKQKRKVYQDGFLELQTSTNKAMLYDECEKLLECRLLKKDEIVTSGGFLIFNGYLVDIGDPEGDNKPLSGLKVDRKDKIIAEGPNLLNRSKARIRSEDNKINVKENKGRQPLSPSQKIIKEFKKRELLKYGSPKISLETTKPAPSEWQVLYTTQVTQKAKKYHDGFLRLVICGSRGGQVMLFDASRTLLDSRFLKKDEVIKSNESITFDGYLVDIGEHQGNYKPDYSVQRNNCTDIERRGMLHRQKISLDTQVTVGKHEWQVLYTKQLTQKFKKYHDGFIQLDNCGSRGKQVVLCDSSRTPIERRFLKKDEVIRPGETVYFDGHLVDVGEPEGNHHSLTDSNEQSNGDNVERRQIRHELNGLLGVNVSAAKRKTLTEASFGKVKDFNSLFSEIDETKSNRMVPPIIPLRDANQILSILQNPEAQESDITGDRPTWVPAPNQGSCENVLDRESTKTMSFKDSTAACGRSSVQFTQNVEMHHQPYSDTEAQIIKSEVDCACGISSSEVGCADESSCKREEDECPSFDLGF